MSVKQLGECLFLDSGTLTPVLKKLEEKGYITRNRSKTDERVLEVKITEKGEDLQKVAVNIPAQMGGCISLSQEESVQLYTLLYKILGKIDA